MDRVAYASGRTAVWATSSEGFATSRRYCGNGALLLTLDVDHPRFPQLAHLHEGATASAIWSFDTPAFPSTLIRCTVGKLSSPDASAYGRVLHRGAFTSYMVARYTLWRSCFCFRSAGTATRAWSALTGMSAHT